MHYQPEFDLRTGRVVAVEALLRWQHPRLGLLGADRFVPAAEPTPAFAGAQRWAMREACAQLARWRHAGLAAELQMRLNVSAPLLLDGRLGGVLLDALAAHRLPAGALCLELTERRMPADLPALAAELARLRRRGVCVALDDFGTGQTTLSQLLDLPADAVKIDRRFVGAMRTDPRCAAVVAAVVGLADALHLDVVAEGVDTPELVPQLIAAGCTRAQGHRLGAPAPADAVAALLRRQQDGRPAAAWPPG